MMTNLNGFSGAALEIHRTGNATWVRKFAASPEGNRRLRRQVYKQKMFESCDTCLKSPRILGEGESCDRYYFDMEFVAGRDGHRFLEGCSFGELRAFTDKLISYIQCGYAKDPLIESPHGSLFDSLVHKLLDIQCAGAGVSLDVFGRLMQQIAALRGCRVPPGFCHGDLTLENIMIDQSGNLWLIDFLDSPFEHPWQDYTKLNQDLLGGWFLLRNRRIGPAVCSYIHGRIINVIRGIFPEFLAYEKILLAVNMCRILPYAKTRAERSFLHERINYFSA